MTTEHDCVRWLIDWVRENRPEVYVAKHADSFNAGVPDLSLTFPDINTRWVEVKRLDSLRPNKNDFPLLQNARLAKFDGLYAIFTTEPRPATRLLVATPAQVLWAMGRKIIPEEGDLESDYLLLIARLRYESSFTNWRLEE